MDQKNYNMNFNFLISNLNKLHWEKTKDTRDYTLL